MTSHTDTQGEQELTFEQQQEVSAILEAFITNPSNSNKFRFGLYAWIAAHTTQAIELASVRARIDELNELKANWSNDIQQPPHRYIKRRGDTLKAQLTQLEGKGEKS